MKKKERIYNTNEKIKRVLTTQIKYGNKCKKEWVSSVPQIIFNSVSILFYYIQFSVTSCVEELIYVKIFLKILMIRLHLLCWGPGKWQKEDSTLIFKIAQNGSPAATMTVEYCSKYFFELGFLFLVQASKKTKMSMKFICTQMLTVMY